MSTYTARRPGAAPPSEFMFVDWPAFTAAPGDREHRPACAGNERMATIDADEAEKLASEYCATCPVLAACNDEAEAMAADHRWCQSPEGVWAGRLWINGKPKQERKRRITEPVTCEHPDRRHYAHGMCEPCYRRKKYQETADVTATCANCGEDKRIYALGRCGACYMRILRATS